MLGLVRRDLLIEHRRRGRARGCAGALRRWPGSAVESGYDLRLVVRELARLTRDLLVLSIDPSRVSDPEIAADAERQALLDLSRRFSGEDLMRAFDVLTKAEYEIRSSMQPRYHLEMALLRWIHLRKLVPLTDLIRADDGGPPVARPRAARAAPAPRRPGTTDPRRRPATGSQRPTPCAGRRSASEPPRRRRAASARRAMKPPPWSADGGRAERRSIAVRRLKEAFLAEIRKAKKFFYGTVVAQAQRIDFEPDRVVFVFGPQHRALRAQLEQIARVARRRPPASSPAGRWRRRGGGGSAGVRLRRPSARSRATEWLRAMASAPAGDLTGDRTQDLKDRAHVRQERPDDARRLRGGNQRRRGDVGA